MVLQGFYHDSSPFTSIVTSIHAGARETGIVREILQMAGVTERIGTLKFSVMYQFKPQPLGPLGIILGYLFWLLILFDNSN